MSGNQSLDENGDEPSYQRGQVVDIINSVISRVQVGGDVSSDLLYKELRDLKDIIEEARSEITFANPDEIKNKHIPTATDELDAVVGATEEATGTIMDSCEVIQSQMEHVASEIAPVIGAEVTKIFEACSFQDITGQRITKVINTLNQIEVKIDSLLSVLGKKIPGLSGGSGEEGESESLLNGPQMPDKAITQVDIDKLLAEFD